MFADADVVSEPYMSHLLFRIQHDRRLICQFCWAA